MINFCLFSCWCWSLILILKLVFIWKYGYVFLKKLGYVGLTLTLCWFLCCICSIFSIIFFYLAIGDSGRLVYILSWVGIIKLFVVDVLMLLTLIFW